jgi:hypothetical protein
VSKQLEQSATEEVFPEANSHPGEHQSFEASAAEADRQSKPHTALQPQDVRTISWLRLGYCFVFLLSILAIFTFWSEVGGQGHLDLMPWYTKLICVLISAWCCVRLTAAMVEKPSVWNRRTVLWLAGLILITLTMAATTYYYHLHEETDQQDSDESTVTAMTPKSPRSLRSFAE